MTRDMDFPNGTSTFLRAFCTPELLNDMLLQSAQLGRRDNVALWTVRRCPEQVVHMIFDLCLRLQVGHIEKYAAVELFERFSELHVKSVRRDLNHGACSPATRRQTRSNLQKQVLLRLVTCIIIAHKFHCSTDKRRQDLRLFLSNCLQIVRVVAPKCTQDILNKSEFRVLQV